MILKAQSGKANNLLTGSSEPPFVPVGASIANAIFDATGVRMTQASLTPVRVRGFLRGAGKLQRSLREVRL